MDDGRGERGPAARSLNEPSLRDGVDLRAVEAIGKPELIGADEEAVGIGADERLITETWAVGMAGSAVAAIVGGIDGERSPGARRVRGLADRDQCMGGGLKGTTCGINTDVEHCQEPVLRGRIEVALGIRCKVSENGRSAANDLWRKSKELVEGRRAG